MLAAQSGGAGCPVVRLDVEGHTRHGLAAIEGVGLRFPTRTFLGAEFAKVNAVDR